MPLGVFALKIFNKKIVSEKQPVVMKFGGTSVGDVAAFERVCGIVASQIERRLIVIVSAIAIICYFVMLVKLNHLMRLCVVSLLQ